MSSAGLPVELEHSLLGLCRLIRVEGMNWVVEVARTRTQLRIPAIRRSEFSPVSAQQDAPTRRASEPESGAGAEEPVVSPPRAGLEPKIPAGQPVDRLRLRRAIESLRNGLPPASAEAHKLTVGFGGLERKVRELLKQVADDGGGVKTVRGAYGQGKTLSLNLAAELALEAGFWVAQTEVDASERRLDRPSNIYHSLMQSLRVPSARGRGVGEMAARVATMTSRRGGVDGNHYHRNLVSVRSWLEDELECPPLAWLLSDPELASKEKLRALLEGDNGWPIRECRNEHFFPGGPRDWPRFSAGSQGDFACFLLSGLGRLSRLLGDRGLVVILDEMEKWQDLSWSQQTRAGNLIGGLIWGATEQLGRRERSTWQRQNVYQPEALEHSGRAGGFPFTTVRRCHLGVLIALTPRGDEGPEELWKRFGSVDIFDLPEFTEEKFRSYVESASAYYAAAYELPAPDVGRVSRRAGSLWRGVGDGSTRAAVRAAIQALDEWRESLNQ